jgi:hypothetical protein
MRLSLALVSTFLAGPAAASSAPLFTPVQPEILAAPAALSNAWADYDSDGDSDLAVSFVSGQVRLYRNDAGVFSSVGEKLGLPAAGPEARGLGWGDYDGDGDPDLYVGVSPGDGPARNLLLRNDAGKTFVDVADSVGVGIPEPDSRQASWIDFDNDGDLDLYVSQRSAVNRLFRNDGARFTDVSAATGMADPRRSVGACWFDMDQDGDLDAFIANQEGDEDAFYRNDGGRFVDVAPALGMHRPGRTPEQGSVGCSAGDFDGDGLLDLFVAAYGRNALYRNRGGAFDEVATSVGIEGERHAVGASWGDADNDGDLDLFVAGYESHGDDSNPLDQLYLNEGGRFRDALPRESLLHGADHGVQWADFDGDGDLDLSLTNTFSSVGRQLLLRNELPPEAARRSLRLIVLDAAGRPAAPGTEVRLRSPDGALIGARLVATGDGYGSQGSTPLHFGLAHVGPVIVEVTFLTPGGRAMERGLVEASAGSGAPVVYRSKGHRPGRRSN